MILDFLPSESLVNWDSNVEFNLSDFILWPAQCDNKSTPFYIYVDMKVIDYHTLLMIHSLHSEK